MTEKIIGIADTMFSRIDMTGIALQALKQAGFEGKIERYTVPGIKDLPVACKKLFVEEGCNVVLALGFVGKADVDKQCAHEASTGIQNVMRKEKKHILEVFMHSNETYTEKKLLEVTENRVSKHARNALELLKGREALQEKAGTGERQGFANEGQITKENADKRKKRIGVVVSGTYPEITGKMKEIALNQLKERNAESIVVNVAGSFETPLAAKRLMERQDIDGAIVLGAIITGETKHDEIIGFATAKQLSELSCEYSKPVGLGIAGPGMTREQAIARSKKMPLKAVNAVMDMLEELGKLEQES